MNCIFSPDEKFHFPLEKLPLKKRTVTSRFKHRDLFVCCFFVSISLNFIHNTEIKIVCFRISKMSSNYALSNEMRRRLCYDTVLWLSTTRKILRTLKTFSQYVYNDSNHLIILELVYFWSLISSERDVFHP